MIDQPRKPPHPADRARARWHGVSEPLVVAVDIGSSSARVGLRDATGAPVGAVAQVRYRMTVDDGGGVSIEVPRLLAVVAEALDQLVARTSARRLGQVVGVGISCFLHSVAGLDRGGRPVTPLLTWADTTSAVQAASLRERLDASAVWQAAGSPLHASYWPAKVLHLRAAAGGAVRSFAGAPELLFEELTGMRAIDLSQASGTGLLDRAAAGWHSGLLRELDLGPGSLPPQAERGATALLGGWAAGRWPALARVPWHLPWSDAWCGNIGLGRTAGRGAALQIGTSGAIRVIVEDPVPLVPAGLFGHRLPDGTALVGGQLSEGGGTAAAVARLLGSTLSGLEAEAARLPPDGHGLTVLPYLAGERGPGYHAEARGVIAGLSLDTAPAEVYLAVLESVALRFRALEARLRPVVGGPPDVTAAGGALSASPLWTTIVAAALGRPIELSAEAEASSRGAALLALAAVGAIDAPEAMPRPSSTPFVPEPLRVERMRRALVRQEDLYRRQMP
jgi:gluconokinase